MPGSSHGRWRRSSGVNSANRFARRRMRRRRGADRVIAGASEVVGLGFVGISENTGASSSASSGLRSVGVGGQDGDWRVESWCLWTMSARLVEHWRSHRGCCESSSLG